MRYCAIWIGVMALNACAQDIDTVVFPHGGKPFTVLDQIEDSRERAAFFRIYNERRPAERKRLAEAFLRSWPQSWLLAQIYEIAAKAAIDLDDYAAAMRYGKEALRLMPENPLLLVPLANVQVQQQLFRNAERSAQEALEYLDRFGRPASFTEAAWPEIERHLRASAYFVLGRTAATEGLSTGRDREKLRATRTHLVRARELNPSDPEIHYLLGLTELALGDKTAAASAFAAAARIPGPLQAKAFEQIVQLGPTGGSPVAEPQPKPTTPAVGFERASYAGSQVCRTCHPAQHAAWQQTGMARMFRPYHAEHVIGDFAARLEFPGARVWQEKDRHYFGMQRADGAWERYPVDYTIGSKWQQAYATRLADGRIQVFPLQYNKLERAWVNYWKIIDTPGSERAELSAFHHMSPATNYQINCAPCHTSQLKAINPTSIPPQELVFQEAGVNCEMCHGPSAGHAAAMSTGGAYSKRPIDPPVDFRHLDARDYVAVCAQCHMQSAMRQPGSHGEWNYSEFGPSFPPRYLSRPFVEFSHRAFYKDGRFRETTFIVEALMRSGCYRRGQAHCGHCHDPHPTDAASNPTSLKYRDQPDWMCLQCHARFAGRVEAHTHHPASSTGSRCVSCHMPRIMNSVLFLARTHQIDDVPRAGMVARFGPQESPNACLLCHKDKDTQWLTVLLRAW